MLYSVVLVNYFDTVRDSIMFLEISIPGNEISLRTCFKSVVSGSSARRTERRNRSVLDVHEDFEHRATQQSDCVAAFKTRSKQEVGQRNPSLPAPNGLFPAKTPVLGAAYGEIIRLLRNITYVIVIKLRMF